MRVVMVMFDSVNRKLLEPYGCDWTKTPNFQRLAHKAVTFDKSYVCSMPCMPARRDFMTGRPNFLHRGWGPVEIFDDALPELLRKGGVQSHLLTDHYHYFEDGGATFHGRYDTWQCFRGQEGDPCVGQVADPVIPANINRVQRRQDWVNRQFLKNDKDYPQTQTFDAGMSFIDRNHGEQNWFLQMECFDPHEPFVAPERFHEQYKDGYDGPLFDWPGYRDVTETPEQVAHCRNNYASLLTMCDESIGRVLDAFDKHDMWKDTMLIVWTDHGYLLGEHNCWAKGWPPMYEEISHTPFFMYDPRTPELQGQRRSALVQPSIDLAPTILDFFGQKPTGDMLGKSLSGVMANDTPVREAAIFGHFNHNLNVTDGTHVYYHTPERNGPAYHYTLMQTTMRGFQSLEAVSRATLREPFGFTKGVPLLSVPASADTSIVEDRKPCLMFDVVADPDQKQPLDDDAVRQKLMGHMTRLMHEAEAPAEQYFRLGIPSPA